MENKSVQSPVTSASQNKSTNSAAGEYAAKDYSTKDYSYSKPDYSYKPSQKTTQSAAKGLVKEETKPFERIKTTEPSKQAKTEPKAEAKTEPKAEIKTERKAEIKTERKAEIKTEAKEKIISEAPQYKTIIEKATPNLKRTTRVEAEILSVEIHGQKAKPETELPIETKTAPPEIVAVKEEMVEEPVTVKQEMVREPVVVKEEVVEKPVAVKEEVMEKPVAVKEEVMEKPVAVEEEVVPEFKACHKDYSKEHEAVLSFIESEMADMCYYSCLCKKAGKEKNRKYIKQLANSKECNAKKLSAAFFILTGDRSCRESRPMPGIPCFSEGVRERYLAELKMAKDYEAAAARSTEPELKVLYSELAACSKKFAAGLKCLLERMG